MLSGMRCAIALAAALGVAGLMGARAEGPEEQYLTICNLIREADLAPGTMALDALPKYNQAKSALEKLQKDFPDWNHDTIRYRLGYLTNRLASLLAAETKPGAAEASVRPVAVPPVDWEVRIAMLEEQVRQLQADKGLLQAKLREALGAQPAASDPRELAQAQARIATLERENALLSAAVTQRAAIHGPVDLFSPLDLTPTAETEAMREAERKRVELINRFGLPTNSPSVRTGRVVRILGGVTPPQ